MKTLKQILLISFFLLFVFSCKENSNSNNTQASLEASNVKSERFIILTEDSIALDWIQHFKDNAHKKLASSPFLDNRLHFKIEAASINKIVENTSDNDTLKFVFLCDKNKLSFAFQNSNYIYKFENDSLKEIQLNVLNQLKIEKNKSMYDSINIPYEKNGQTQFTYSLGSEFNSNINDLKDSLNPDYYIFYLAQINNKIISKVPRVKSLQNISLHKLTLITQAFNIKNKTNSGFYDVNNTTPPPPFVSK